MPQPESRASRVSQAGSGTLSLPALSRGISSGRPAVPSPSVTLEPNKPAVGERPLAHGAHSWTPGLLAPPTRPTAPVPAGNSSFSSSPRTGQKGPGRGTHWPFSALPWQPPVLAKAERAAAGGRNITALECTRPPLPIAWDRVSPRGPPNGSLYKAPCLPEAPSPSEYKSWHLLSSCCVPGPMLSFSEPDHNRSFPQAQERACCYSRPFCRWRN